MDPQRRNKVKVKVIGRLTVSRPVCLGFRHPSGTRDQYFPFSIQLLLDSCGFLVEGRPLWREVGSERFSFCWASPEHPFSELSPTGLINIFYCLSFWDSPNLVGRIPVFISPRNKVAQSYPPPWGYFVRSATHYLRSYNGFLRNTPNTSKRNFLFLNPLLFASCTNTFSKCCEITTTTDMKRSAQ
jgi:hypothetical protein